MRELNAAIAGYEEQQRQADYRAYVIATVMAQSQGSKTADGQPYTAVEWFPSIKALFAPKPDEDGILTTPIEAAAGPGEFIRPFGEFPEDEEE